MSIRDIKDKLKSSIETGDEALIHLLNAAVDAYKTQSASDYKLTPTQKSELDRRTGLSEPQVTWDKAKKQIRRGAHNSLSTSWEYP